MRTITEHQLDQLKKQKALKAMKAAQIARNTKPKSIDKLPGLSHNAQTALDALLDHIWKTGLKDPYTTPEQQRILEQMLKHARTAKNELNALGTETQKLFK